MIVKKILTIPDLHGRTNWKSEFDPYFDYTVFTGDYLDAHESDNISNTEILDNLMRIIELKLKYPNKIILLWGNHEIPYLFHPYGLTEKDGGYGCSGFRAGMYPVVHQLLNKHKFIFNYAFQINDYIWTHAGIHVGWWNFRFKGNIGENIADQLNEAFRQRMIGVGEGRVETLMDCGIRRDGRQKIGGPLWADKSELWLKPLPGYKQIVGHNPVFDIVTSPIKKNGSITFCDCLHMTENYHVVEIDVEEKDEEIYSGI